MKGAEDILAPGGAFPQASSAPAAANPGARRLIVISGLPGAGKTMLASRLGLHLKRKGARVRMLLADHQRQLADLALLRADGFRTEEIWTGCANAEANEADPPQMLIAEAVQAFDLASSPIDPFRPCLRNGGNIAPLSVVIDPVRAGRVFGIEPGGTFSARLASLYRQQLADAEIVVLNKCDLLPGESLKKLSETIKRELPHCIVCTVSVRTGEGLDEWFQCLMSKVHTPRPPAPAARADEAGALLASLNCTVKLSSVKYWDSGKLIMEIATGIQSLLRTEGAEVAHLKMVLAPVDDLGELTALNLIRNDGPPVLSREISEPIQAGELLLNLKAEADPETLHAAVNKALLAVVEKHSHLFLRMEHCEHYWLGRQS